MKGRTIYAAIILFVLIAGIASSGCIGGSREKSWLELVPSDAIVAGVFDMSTVKEAAFEELMKNLSLYPKYESLRENVLNETGVDIATLSRAIFAVRGYDEETQQPKMAIYVEGSVDVEKVKGKIEGLNETIYHAKYRGVDEYFDSKNWGVAISENYIIVGDKDTIEEVIDLIHGKGKWAKQYREIVKKVGSGNLIAVYDFRALMNLTSSERESSELSTPIPLGTMEESVKYGAFKFVLTNGNYSFRVVLEMDSPTDASDMAKQLRGFISLLDLKFSQQGGSALVEILKDIEISTSENFVLIDLTVSGKQLEELLTYEAIPKATLG